MAQNAANSIKRYLLLLGSDIQGLKDLVAKNGMEDWEVLFPSSDLLNVWSRACKEGIARYESELVSHVAETFRKAAGKHILSREEFDLGVLITGEPHVLTHATVLLPLCTFADRVLRVFHVTSDGKIVEATLPSRTAVLNAEVEYGVLRTRMHDGRKVFGVVENINGQKLALVAAVTKGDVEDMAFSAVGDGPSWLAEKVAATAWDGAEFELSSDFEEQTENTLESVTWHVHDLVAEANQELYGMWNTLVNSFNCWRDMVEIITNAVLDERKNNGSAYLNKILGSGWQSEWVDTFSEKTHLCPECLAKLRNFFREYGKLPIGIGVSFDTDTGKAHFVNPIFVFSERELAKYSKSDEFIMGYGDENGYVFPDSFHVVFPLKGLCGSFVGNPVLRDWHSSSDVSTIAFIPFVGKHSVLEPFMDKVLYVAKCAGYNCSDDVAEVVYKRIADASCDPIYDIDNHNLASEVYFARFVALEKIVTLLAERKGLTRANTLELSSAILKGRYKEEIAEIVKKLATVSELASLSKAIHRIKH